jgi:hypothetical protein
MLLTTLTSSLILMLLVALPRWAHTRDCAFYATGGGEPVVFGGVILAVLCRS